MDYLLKLDWSNTFAPQLTLPEVLVIPRWQAGPGSIASLLFVVLLGGDRCFAWLSYRFPWFRRLAQDSPTCLSREMISDEDLKARLRR